MSEEFSVTQIVGQLTESMNKIRPVLLELIHSTPYPLTLKDLTSLTFYQVPHIVYEWTLYELICENNIEWRKIDSDYIPQIDEYKDFKKFIDTAIFF